MTSPSDFHANRRTGIGGSDMGVILGLVGSKADLWLTKMGRKEPIEPTDRMLMGILQEPVILAEYKRRRPEHKVRRCNRQLRHKLYPTLVGHVDGLVGREGIVECKYTADSTGWGPDGSDRIPAYYRAQCLHYLDVTDRSWAELIVLLGDRGEFRIYRIERNEAVNQEIVSNRLRALDWWAEHVAGEKAPEPESSFDAAALWPEAASGTASEFDDSLLSKLSTLHEKKQVLKALEDEIRPLELAVKAALQDNEAGIYHGRTVVTWSTQTRPGLDTKRLQAEEPEIAARYVTQTSYRVLRIKDRELASLTAATVPDAFGQAG